MRPALGSSLLPLVVAALLGLAGALFAFQAWPASAQSAPVAITGTPKFGEILTADTSGIRPEDYSGVAGSSLTFTYQWVRSKGGTDTDIPSATSLAYRVAHDDFRHQVKVKVGFTVGSDEHMETSAAVGQVLGTLTQPSTPYTAPSDALWSATIGVESSGGGLVGYNNVSGSMFGSLSENFVFFDRRINGIIGADIGFYLNFQQEALEHPGWERWTLHVNDDVELPLSEMDTFDVAIGGLFLGHADGDYGDLWEEGSRHTVYISTPGTRATGAPSISGNVAVGQTLTVDTSAIVDADGLTSPTFFYQWFRIVEGEEVRISNIVDTSDTYTVRRSDAGRRLKVEVLFVDDEDNTEVLSSTLTDEVPGPPTLSTITVDTSPLVTRHADGVDYYASGDEIGLSVNFTKAVDVTGTPQLEFFIGNESKTADYDSVSSTSRALKFKYTVEPGDRGQVGVRSEPVKLSTGDAITGDDDTPADCRFSRSLGRPFSRTSGHPGSVVL